MRGYRTRYKRPPGWAPWLACQREREGHSWPLDLFDGPLPGEHECSRCHLIKVITRAYRRSDLIMNRCTKPEAHGYTGDELLECGDTGHRPDDGRIKSAKALSASGAGEPVGKTSVGVTVWQVPGRKDRHLSWGGLGDHVHLHHRSMDIDGNLFLGRDAGTVSGRRCYTLAEAQAEADDYVRKEAA